jgi:hypothetical protein
VPSLLYYYEELDKAYRSVGWGTATRDALTLPDNALESRILKVEQFKFHLKPSDSFYAEHCGIPALPPRLSAIRVVSDYLSEIGQVLRPYIKDFHAQHLSSIQHYFTVPTSWDAEVKAAFRTAILLSGFLRDGDSLTFVADLEACAAYCHQIGLLDVKCREALLVVDGGFSSVDICAYEVATYKPFSLTTISASTDLHGLVP